MGAIATRARRRSRRGGGAGGGGGGGGEVGGAAAANQITPRSRSHNCARRENYRRRRNTQRGDAKPAKRTTPRPLTGRDVTGETGPHLDRSPGETSPAKRTTPRPLTGRDVTGETDHTSTAHRARRHRRNGPHLDRSPGEKSPAKRTTPRPLTGRCVTGDTDHTSTAHRARRHRRNGPHVCLVTVANRQTDFRGYAHADFRVTNIQIQYTPQIAQQKRTSHVHARQCGASIRER